MSEDVPVKKVTVGGNSRVAFFGTGTFRLPESESREIIKEAWEKFDMDGVEDETTLAVATVATDPTHRLVGIDWCEDDDQ